MARLTEGIVNQLIEYYQARFDGEVDEINEETGDGLLAYPAEYFAGLQSFNASLNYDAAVFVLGGETRIERYNAQYTDASHDIEIMVAAIDSDPVRLQSKLYRYGRIAWRLLVRRFFETDESDYPTIGPASGAPEPRIVYERPGGEDQYQSPTAGRQVGKVHLFVTVNRQEDN